MNNNHNGVRHDDNPTSVASARQNTQVERSPSVSVRVPRKGSVQDHSTASRGSSRNPSLGHQQPDEIVGHSVSRATRSSSSRQPSERPGSSTPAVHDVHAQNIRPTKRRKRTHQEDPPTLRASSRAAPTDTNNEYAMARREQPSPTGDVSSEEPHFSTRKTRGPIAEMEPAENTNKRSSARRSRRKDQPLQPDTNTDDPQESIEVPDQGATSAKRGKARERARKVPDQVSVEEAAAAIVEAAVQGSSKQQEKKDKKGKRNGTPEGAELVQIAPSEVRMAELCKDNRTGRPSMREKELKEIDRAMFVKKKQGQLKELMGEAESLPPSTDEASRLERQDGQRDVEEEIALHVPNTIIVNGQIQIDESSLRIDRHAVAAVARDARQLEGVEESELSRKITSASFLRRDKGGSWNRLLQDRFYDGLRMFGTDFGMISKLFPGKSRHAIKLKFCREEKENPAKIKAVLLGEQLPIDLDEFQRLTGTEYRDPAILDKEMEEDRRRLEEDQAAENEAKEQERRERAEQAASEKEVATGDEGSARENDETPKGQSTNATKQVTNKRNRKKLQSQKMDDRRKGPKKKKGQLTEGHVVAAED